MRRWPGSKHDYVHRGITKLSKQAQKILPKNSFLVPFLFFFLFYLQQCEFSLCTTLENNLNFSYTFLHLHYKTVLSPQRHGSWSVCACVGCSIHFSHKLLTCTLKVLFCFHFWSGYILVPLSQTHQELCFVVQSASWKLRTFGPTTWCHPAVTYECSPMFLKLTIIRLVLIIKTHF